MPYLKPNVIRETSEGLFCLPIEDLMLQRREIWLAVEIDDQLAGAVASQLLQLAAEAPEAEITMYINSPGGSVSAGLAIYDIMQAVPCPIRTVCIGMAASMGAFLISSGAKGKRIALPNAEIMIHQPSAGTQGQVTDMAIHLKRLETIKKKINEIMASNTGKSV